MIAEFGWILAGFGALAAGIGVFRAGFALGRAVGRVTDTFESAVGKHLEGQEKIIGLAEQAIPLLAKIQAGQDDIHKELRASDTSVRALWREFWLMKGDAKERPEADK
jgi:hypothetical protein